MSLMVMMLWWISITGPEELSWGSIGAFAGVCGGQQVRGKTNKRGEEAKPRGSPGSLRSPKAALTYGEPCRSRKMQ
ncbi:hypothetical protein EDD36DRAFT_206645 [Exophiala viscosa]|uniref:Secreted protein n=1 Tax=Exophiala viscosa TaxID=2486360 RepID=A0AAN6DYS3_9EURO|nr:hypothetical protein EDD36DRAFT_206645 [Exophiala viscosa]